MPQRSPSFDRELARKSGQSLDRILRRAGTL